MKNILVVEDDESLRDIFTIIFTRAGYRVFVFTNGSEVSGEDWKRADIIFLDVSLPGKNGVEICVELKRNAATKDIPVILVSASPRERFNRTALGCEDAFLEKPFDPSSLVSLVQKFTKE